MPILLYGCENWIMTESLWQTLEPLQACLVKKMLMWPKHHLNTAALTAVEVPTMKSTVLIAMLSFFKRVMKSDSCSLSGQAVFTLSESVDSVCLVKECREVEEGSWTHFTDEILGRRELCLKNVKKAIYEHDREQLAVKCSVKRPFYP